MSEPKESDYDPVQSSTDHFPEEASHPAFVGADDLFVRHRDILAIFFPDFAERKVQVLLRGGHTYHSGSADAEEAFREYLS